MHCPIESIKFWIEDRIKLGLLARFQMHDPFMQQKQYPNNIVTLESFV